MTSDFGASQRIVKHAGKNATFLSVLVSHVTSLMSHTSNQCVPNIATVGHYSSGTLHAPHSGRLVPVSPFPTPVVYRVRFSNILTVAAVLMASMSCRRTKFICDVLKPLL